ncbi:hypothetical protein [Paenibacillus qinlingensis]|uniref:Uncharacterized protein n=1 Tax=Paenibacillus qinlingensis TaxID=1837343 RepID=A0ABU1NQH2_9BACL|nr:hypothetical protein [Paenibacillus qinlingensis]MDR6549713.1 hypothetical protein [Paenibacillus qinlingensis]
MGMASYHFANLDIHEELMQELRNLESRMKEELGYEIALIAYTKEADGLPNN